ncbi:hypothetical protein [Candidatus Poriferisodalis sp.]|uniref:hypothetical protein n=1 Tax=Candidatus Poriferisodalis sp. TaxID=3101277 RepID=UPI003C7007CF
MAAYTADLTDHACVSLSSSGPLSPRNGVGRLDLQRLDQRRAQAVLDAMAEVDVVGVDARGGAGVGDVDRDIGSGRGR